MRRAVIFLTLALSASAALGDVNSLTGNWTCRTLTPVDAPIESAFEIWINPAQTHFIRNSETRLFTGSEHRLSVAFTTMEEGTLLREGNTLKLAPLVTDLNFQLGEENVTEDTMASIREMLAEDESAQITQLSHNEMEMFVAEYDQTSACKKLNAMTL